MTFKWECLFQSFHVMATRPQKNFCQLTLMAATPYKTPNQTLTPIVGSLLYVTPKNFPNHPQKPQNNHVLGIYVGWLV